MTKTETYRTDIASSTPDSITVFGRDLPSEILGTLNFGDMAFLELTSRIPDEKESRMFNAMLVTLVEHGLTPSTLVARLTYLGAPESLQGAVAAGLNGLGTVFVGSTEGAAKMLYEAPEALEGEDLRKIAEQVVEQFEHEKRQIPGIGHPFHKPVDPRAPRLIQIAQETGFDGRYLALIQQIAHVAGERKGRDLPANATGILGALCCEMGLDWKICRGLGVMARAVGIVGHLLEEGREPIARKLWLETEARATEHVGEKGLSIMSNPSSLQGKVIVISGAGRGIGREIALECGRAGARVVVNDIGAGLDGEGTDASPANDVVQAIREAGGEAVASLDSVAEWDSANRIISTALDTFGRVDAVVNNAGILRDRFFFNMNPEEWKAVIDVHLNGAFFMSRAAASHMKKQQSGAFVHIVSTTGLIGNLGQANYGAAKLGIAAMSKCIAMDMARYNVRSNCVSPFAMSRMIGSIPSETPEQQARLDKLKTMEPGKIAPFVAYLASDLAQEVSGQIFAVRANEIFLMSQSRPLRSVHADGGWSIESIAERAIPAMQANFYPLDRSQDVFSWDPV